MFCDADTDTDATKQVHPGGYTWSSLFEEMAALRSAGHALPGRVHEPTRARAVAVSRPFLAPDKDLLIFTYVSVHFMFNDYINGGGGVPRGGCCGRGGERESFPRVDWVAVDSNLAYTATQILVGAAPAGARACLRERRRGRGALRWDDGGQSCRVHHAVPGERSYPTRRDPCTVRAECGAVSCAGQTTLN
eukprot:SAG25_NODE_79_length_16803_cov_43.538194_8_plen_191_part_00